MKGIYALAISVKKNIVVNVGALHEIPFEKGLYVYVGSAQNGLEKRTSRHLRKIKRRFWHIDYLLAAGNVSVLKVFGKKGSRSEECKLARELDKIGTAIKGFGSSDCGCKGHLFKLSSHEFLSEWMDELSLTRAKL
jgi:Uri superfamily endonuclease